MWNQVEKVFPRTFRHEADFLVDGTISSALLSNFTDTNFDLFSDLIQKMFKENRLGARRNGFITSSPASATYGIYQGQEHLWKKRVHQNEC